MGSVLAQRYRLRDKDAFEWAPDSEVAKRALKDLVGHVDQRYGVHVDTLGGHVTLNAPELAAQLAGVERDRAVANRVHTARDRMVEIVAADKDIAESAKRELYTNIDDWKRNPSGHSLQELTKKVTAAGLNEKARNKIRFVAAYLGTPDGQIPINELGAVAALSATSELRKTTEPLVDPAEEVKPRIDDMLVRYQDRLRHGVNPESITKQLTAAVNLLPSDEQTAARQRGTDIRANPAAEFKPLWPNHVDRDQLDAVVRMYAAMAPQVEAMAVHDEPFDEDVRAQMRKQADKHRRTIEHAIAKGRACTSWSVTSSRRCWLISTPASPTCPSSCSPTTAARPRSTHRVRMRSPTRARCITAASSTRSCPPVRSPPVRRGQLATRSPRCSTPKPSSRPGTPAWPTTSTATPTPS
ncbi:hypothetical protein [Nocardia sp. IFM 10818]